MILKIFIVTEWFIHKNKWLYVILNNKILANQERTLVFLGRFECRPKTIRGVDCWQLNCKTHFRSRSEIECLNLYKLIPDRIYSTLGQMLPPVFVARLKSWAGKGIKTKSACLHPFYLFVCLKVMVSFLEYFLINK